MPTPSRHGKFLLMERIGSGGMAEVHRAVLCGNAGFAKPVALKRMLPALGESAELVRRFKEEARVTSMLSHACIAQVFELGEMDGRPYLAMEHVDGLDLGALSNRMASASMRLPAAACAFVLAEAARGLAHAHEARGRRGEWLGIVHRDMSPQNVLLSRAGEVKITDFGIALARGREVRTASGMVLGKLVYMAPEQLAGEPVDARADVFALGAILYELLAGQVPFPDQSEPAVMARLQGAKALPPSVLNPSAPRELEAIAMRALSFRRDERYPTARAMVLALSTYLGNTAPHFSREELAALVQRWVPPARGTCRSADTAPLQGPKPAQDLALLPTVELVGRHAGDAPVQADHATESILSRRAHGRLGWEAWLGIALALVIVLSASLTVLRLVR
ncbi:MAG: serine/threonine protein kinase [Deltaproteobacteria bacterium]|nr:serine/threonine protein kinase [Deltaproteobacteria bacterium]